MKWEKGKSGNPGGRVARKPMTDALMRALMEASDKGDWPKARDIADQLVEKARAGDTRAAELIFDRIEGKPDVTVHLNRSVRSLDDSELSRVITEGGGSGTSVPAISEGEPSLVH